MLATDKVRAVEALFDNGRVLRDDAPGGIFALFSLDTAGPCELRDLGRDGRILGRLDLVAESRRFGGMDELSGIESGGWRRQGGRTDSLHIVFQSAYPCPVARLRRPRPIVNAEPGEKPGPAPPTSDSESYG